MDKKVVLFTANVQGGILQLTLQLYKTLIEEYFEASVVMPYEIQDIDIGSVEKEDLIQYHKEKKVVDQTPYKRLALEINKIHPDYIWYMDDSVICSNVGTYLNGEIKQLLILHDAGTHHPTNHKSIRTVLVEKYTEMVNKRFYKRVHRFVLLSPESMRTFSQLYPSYKDKAVMMTLGAHLPDVDEIKPTEICIDNRYFLFFGRIDKYKGIGNLLDAYRDVSDKSLPLIIAGGGKFTDKERKLIEGCNNLMVINRYIGDGEMKWLLAHMTAAVLPYLEATQSGIIPLAYLFGKPVLVSNVVGLTQFVADGETGVICRSEEEWKKALKKFSSKEPNIQESKIRDYYQTHMDWNRNIRELFSRL